MTASNPDSARYAFGRFVLDLPRGVLLEAGAERGLRPKSFALLQHLAENRGRLISRDEIMHAVWPNTFVTEDSITQCIREIRRALGDDGQALLRTMPRRGYMLAGPGQPDPISTSDAPELEETRPAMALPLPADHLPAGRPMVIVPPFETIGGDPEQRYFADGLSADLVTDLTRFQELQIVSPQRRPSDLDTPDWMALSGASPTTTRFILAGSVRRAAGQLRITVHLKDGKTDANLWADRFDRPLEGLFEVQEELANRIAAMVNGYVGRENLRRVRHRSPANLDAYDLYLQGREAHGLATKAGTLLARRLFDRAIAADPGYAPALAYQAYTVQRGFTFGWGDPIGHAALHVALGFADRAVALEPEMSLCMIRQALVLALLGRHDEAVESARRAAVANPCDAAGRASYGEVLSMAGAHAAGVAELRTALALDPFHPPFWWGAIGRALLLAGHAEEALLNLRRCVARAPDYRPCHSSMVVACVETGRLQEARIAAAEVLRLRPGFVISNYDGVFGFRNQTDTDRFLHAFLVAGMPVG